MCSFSEIILHPYSYKKNSDAESMFCYTYLEKFNFYSKTHPLSPVLENLQGLIQLEGDSKTPSINAVRLVLNMLYDTYNNGTGNVGHWAISKEFKRSIQKAGYPESVVQSLKKRLSLVYDCMGRGRRFGWVSKGFEDKHKYEIECLLTDCVYYAALQCCPDTLAKIEPPKLKI